MKIKLKKDVSLSNVDTSGVPYDVLVALNDGKEVEIEDHLKRIVDMKLLSYVDLKKSITKKKSDKSESKE